jgi:hypothetical protein
MKDDLASSSSLCQQKKHIAWERSQLNSMVQHLYSSEININATRVATKRVTEML